MKKYAVNKKSFGWAICGDGDIEPERIVFEEVVNRLQEYSKEGKIVINPNPEAQPWNIAKTVYMVEFLSEGWVGEYPYLGFDFQYKKDSNEWTWLGVCYSTAPPLRISEKTGKYEEVYFHTPALPRPGPRVFKDPAALYARIKEIVRFGKFAALSQYAIKQKVRFGECSSTMVNDKIQGKDVPVGNVIEFLNKIASDSNRVKFRIVNPYLESAGWSNDYSYIYFQISHGSEGWEWTGAAYCKTSLGTVLSK